MGQPKALVRDATGDPWVSTSTRLLLDAGCERAIVVLGAAADEARLLVPFTDAVTVVVSEDWADGMSASLRAGLGAATGTAALVTLVDLPGMPLAAVTRVLEWGGVTAGAGVLRQAVYGGRPGHPVLIGSDHWDSVADGLTGDHGARAYLVAHGVEEIECGDLFDGDDVDSVIG